ncbi:MAG: tetratricopeptide repeat protein [Chitinispirillaceae bacterium]|nr:tetratricopeptide repeat protein [Chitinispirillaceae bacterium]
MDPFIYTGRKVQKLILTSFLSTAFRSRLPHDTTDAVSPRLFLFHGENGLGKSSLIDLCIETIEDISAAGRNAVPLLLDLDAWRFSNGLVPKTPRELLNTLYGLAAGTNEKIGSTLAPFDVMNKRAAELRDRWNSLVRREWPRCVFLKDNPEEKNGRSEKPVPEFATWMGEQIKDDEKALVEDPIGQLTGSLVECLAKASLEMPFALLVDGHEQLEGSPAGDWLKTAFLPSLLSTKNNLVVVISSSAPFVREFRNSFAEELMYPVELSTLCLTKSDITVVAEKRGVSSTPEQVTQIENATAGIPLVVKTVLDAASMNIPLGKVLSRKTASAGDADRLVRECVDRFVKTIDHGKDRSAIFSIAMLYRLDENMLAELWGGSPEDVTTLLNDLALRYSFMQGGQLHAAIRDLVRSYLIEEVKKGDESPLAESFKNFSSISATLHEQYLEQMLLAMPDAAIRYADPNFRITLLGLLNGHLWAQQEKIAGILPGLFIETLHYAPDFTETLLEFAGEGTLLLSKETSALIDTLRTGSSVAALLKEPLSSGKRSTLKALDFIKPWESGMNAVQQGLLSRMRGQLACHVGSYDKAVESFNKSESLLPEASLLFDDYLCAGYAFIAANDFKKAVSVLAKAVALRPDDYFARYRLALAHQSLGEHHAAIASFQDAVTIKPGSFPAWIELGNEQATVADYEKAAEAFSRATELDANRPAAWFNLGIALEALSRFGEAQKALARAVEILPDHWEALFALGRSQSAQELSQDAIASFNKAVEIKPDCIDALKALGNELFGIESYERAAAALEKAVKLDPADYALWDLLGKSWFGAGRYEQAVNASQKAVDLKDDLFSAWVNLGQSHTEQSNFKEACAAFTKAADLNPKDNDIWVSVGNSLYAQGKYEESITAYLKAVEFHPEVDSIWNNIGLAYQVQQHYSEAIEAFQKAVTINPAGADSWYQLGRSFAELDRHAEAADSFSKALEITPDAHDAWYRKGLSLSKIGNHAEAVATFIRASEINPTDADIWYQTGLSYVASGAAEEAVTAFSRAIALAANRPEVHFQLGLAQESLSRFEEAADAYRKAVNLSAEKSEAWYHLGLCCNFLSLHDEAILALNKVLEITPDNTEVFLPIALAAHASSDFGQAVTFYRKVIDRKPDSEEALYNLALALHAMNNYEEALPAYHAVVKKWPDKDQAWYNMGLAYHAAGDFTQAINSYREATRLNPDSPEVWYHLGLVFYATEHYGEAIQAFRKVISRAPDMYEAWFNIGNAYLVWHEYNDAIEAYEKASLLKPDDYTSWGYLGNAYFGAGLYDKAQEASGKAFALNSEEPWIIATLALSRLFTGDSAGAGPLFEALIATDTAGQEIARAVHEIQKALAANPGLSGAQEILQKLAGEASTTTQSPNNPTITG